MVKRYQLLVMTVCLGVTVAQSFGQPPAPRTDADQQGIQSPRITSKEPREKNQELMDLVNEAIEVSSHRYLTAAEHSPWQIYHGTNAFRRKFMLDLNGELIPAIDWLSTTNPQFRGTPWFQKTPYGGRAHRFTEPYHFEGHPNQSLALMVMCNLPKEHTFQTDDGPITVQDIINNAKMTINSREELTWTLWFLTHYLDSDDTWKTRRGETWSLERLVEDEINTQVTKAACGGTHNLYALAVARNNYVREGGRIRGVWLKADQKVKRYLVAARSIQRSDGSFPTKYFRGYGYPKTFSEQIASSGHMMEWIVVAIEDRQLDDSWIEKGISHICQKLIKYSDQPAECGPLYHAVSALILYRDRVNGVPWPDPEIQLQSPTEEEPSLVDQTQPAVDPAVEMPQAELELKTATQPQPQMLIRITPDEDLASQAKSGKVTVDIEEEIRNERTEPSKPVERLAAPEEKESVVE